MSSQIFIFINVQKALDAGIKFFLSDNGVVLTAGDHDGLLKPEFFDRVENTKRVALPGWEGLAAPTVEKTRMPVPETEGYQTPPV